MKNLLQEKLKIPKGQEELKIPKGQEELKIPKGQEEVVKKRQYIS